MTIDQRTVSAPGARLLTLARFDAYPRAAHLVDRLSDAGFPVEHTRIVGNGLRSVEAVTGRLTKGRAALYGAGTGAWFGLFIALLFAIFTLGPVWWGVLGTTVLLGALFGAIAGFLGHWVTGGRRPVRGGPAAGRGRAPLTPVPGAGPRRGPRRGRAREGIAVSGPAPCRCALQG